MKFIPYVGEDGKTHYFDAHAVQFTMAFQIGPVDEHGKVQQWGTKVAFNTSNHGFVISTEPADVLIKRIEEANGLVSD